MKNIVKMIVAVVLLVSNVTAEESEAKRLCDAEIKKEEPQRSVVENQCLQVAKEYEANKNYGNASWYYILSDKGIYTFELVKKYNKKEKDIYYHQDLGFAYLVNNNINESKKMFKVFIINGGLHISLQVLKDLKILYKLNLIKKKEFEELSIWLDRLHKARSGSGRIKRNKIKIDYDNRLSVLNGIKLYEARIKDSEKLLEVQTIIFSTDNEQISKLYHLAGDIDNAYTSKKKMLLIVEQLFGKYYSGRFIYYSKIIQYSLENKQYLKAYKDVTIMFNDHLIQMQQNSYFNKQEMNKFLISKFKRVSLYLKVSYAYLTNQSNINMQETLQNIMNSWLNYKGSIFDSENAIATLYANTKDVALKEKIDNLISYKRYLAKLYQSLPKPSERKQWQSNIKQTEEKISSLTSEISSKAESFKESQGLKSISYKDISKNLKENELYIDYAKAGEYYYVFSLDSTENITFTQINVNNTKKIDSLVKTFREDVTTILDDTSITDEKLKALTTASKEKLSQLYELVLRKTLSKELKTKTNLILSPDGALRLLPFEAMFDKKNSKYLIEQKEIRYIPSGKELVRLYRYSATKKEATTTNKQNHTATIFSNPNFDAKDVTKVASQIKEEDIAITPNTNRAGIIKSLFKMRFSPLPETRAEAQSIEQTLHGKTDITEYKQEEANEVNLMNIKQPKILHIATHGFFINDNTIPNPMLKSGIALSGANASAIRGKSDGIVTALKLSGLKLKGTDLVVLSACQTGVVDINSTDSVSGLSKAFIQAGAKDIVMSLWSVDDQATKELMSSFYRKMQTEPSYATALKEAKLKMIEKGLHPFYWAPFVVSGL